MKKITIIVGSESDLDIVNAAKVYLDFFNLSYELKVLSAHRQHDELQAYIREIEKEGIVQTIIACAGMAAHLPGVIAAMTQIPVIGVPLDASPLGGVDALYSIVQMPKGIPVATMAIGKAGVINAVVFSAKILALNDSDMKTKLVAFQQKGSKL
ncbi:MAG: 5-(carboxyamino)imidazole ribonucleotide mutase [Candidatus Marinimicrobia bacterium]|nr:5-(carboxyamino)imidazole ribonucleotide mutase [Candidatus Neomarinimicrobiota bacterium]